MKPVATGIVVHGTWAEIQPLIDGTAKRLPYVEVGHYLLAFEEPLTYQCFLRDEGERAEWATTKAAALPYTTRRTEDGALVVKSYGGTAQTDPRFRGGRLDVAAAGVTSADLTEIVAGRMFQGIRFQVLNAAPGDTLTLAVHAGTPGGPVVQSFGERHAPMPTGASGWGCDDGVMFGAAKLFPAMLGEDLPACYMLDYHAVDAAPRIVLYDVLVHE